MRIGRVAAGCSVAVLAALALAACAGGGSSGDAPAQPGASGSGNVAELRSLEPLKAADRRAVRGRVSRRRPGKRDLDLELDVIAQPIECCCQPVACIMQPLSEPLLREHLVVTAHEHVETHRQYGTCGFPRLFNDLTVLKHPGTHLLVISFVRAGGWDVVHERGERAVSFRPDHCPVKTYRRPLAPADIRNHRVHVQRGGCHFEASVHRVGFRNLSTTSSTTSSKPRSRSATDFSRP